MTKWKKVSEARYNEVLDALPPAVWAAVGFLVGEPFDHTADGYRASRRSRRLTASTMNRPNR
jgi:hypothetical protein